jgi:tetratricopeptide (TPR) repeat protein
LKLRQFIPVLIVAAGIWAYHNSFQGPFIFDDTGSILDNPTIRHLWPIWKALSPPHGTAATVEARPLLNLSLAVNYAVGGTRPLGYHMLNLAIHIAAGLVLFGIVWRTLLQPPLHQRFGTAADPLALAVAVIWVVHPLQTESVTYVVQRAESMMGLFYLLTLYCAIRGAESDGPSIWYSLSVASCLLGMASKEVMVSAPVIVLLYDRAFMAGSFREAWRRRRWLYLGLGATWICLAWLVISAQRLGTTSAIAKSKGITWWAYLLTEPGVILHYLRLSVWPQPLCLDYLGWPVPGTWPSILPSAMLMVALVGATVWAWRSTSIPSAMGPAWGFLGAWFLLILAPTSSLVPMDSPAYEHRMYLPLASVIAVVGVGVLALGKRLWNKPQRTAFGCVATACVAVLFTFLTLQRNRDYHSTVSIWQDTLQKRPTDPRAYYNLGNALAQIGRVQEAMDRYQQALRIKPDYAEAEYNWAVALDKLGRVQEAIPHYEQVVRLEPDDAEAQNNLAVILGQAGRIEDAIRHWEQALKIKPDFAEAHFNWGNVLLRAGKLPEAAGQYEQALQIKPDLAEAHYNLGNVFLQAGRLPEAVGHYGQALRIKPDFVLAHINLGMAVDQLGRTTEAIQHCEQALRIQPDLVLAHINLGIALARVGRADEATEHLDKVLRLEPDSAEAHYDLGVALEKLGRTPEAIQHYQQALRIRPGFAEAQSNLARAQAAQ